MDDHQDPHRIRDLGALADLYGQPGGAALAKVSAVLTPAYRRWIERSRFCVLATVGPEGADASPRGDDGPVVRIADERVLLLPDWRGNNRIDSLRNIVQDDRVSLMFMVHGSNQVVRVNGRAQVTVDPCVVGLFDRGGQAPRSVIRVRATQVYFQCAKALMRSGLWVSRESDLLGLPTAGAMLADATHGAEGGAEYDARWPARAATSMW